MKLDKRDPLYDSEDEDKNYVLVSGSVESDSYMGGASPPRHSYDPERRRQVIGPLLTLSEFKIRLADALREYFLSGDTQECLQRIGGELAIISGGEVERTKNEREATSDFVIDANSCFRLHPRSDPVLLRALTLPAHSR